MARRSVYDRRRILDAAADARARGRRHRAIPLYRWVLAVERHNPELHARLAPLLAEDGQCFDAWQSFRHCAQAALREGREERALVVYRDATRMLPHEIQSWQSLARVLARRGEEGEAVAVLLEGSRRFRSRRQRPEAIHLLRRARNIDPWHFECVLALARHLSRSRQLEEARMLLEGLVGRAQGRELRRIRAAQLRADGSLGAVWRWLRALLDRTADDPEHDADKVVPIRPNAAGRGA